MRELIFSQKMDEINPTESIKRLESGELLFFPNHCFDLIDPSLINTTLLEGKRKNISFDPQKNKLAAYSKQENDTTKKLERMMKAYAEYAFQLIQKALPTYSAHLQWGRTSFRPAEIKGRVSSKRKDDTRLHVDAFPSSPVNGLRILRVFSNVNPHQQARVWNVGEPFGEVLKQFAPQFPKYSKLKARALELFKATKSLRSAYDHYMLQLHDQMKLDDHYQQQVQKIRIDFPAQSSWIVFTDVVSHAALSGQYLLEQTFYLPVQHMAEPQLSPWHQLQNFTVC